MRCIKKKYESEFIEYLIILADNVINQCSVISGSWRLRHANQFESFSLSSRAIFSFSRAKSTYILLKLQLNALDSRSAIRNLCHQNSTSYSRFRSTFLPWQVFLFSSSSYFSGQVFTFCIVNGRLWMQGPRLVSVDFINNSLLKCIFFIELKFLLAKAAMMWLWLKRVVKMDVGDDDDDDDRVKNPSDLKCSTLNIKFLSRSQRQIELVRSREKKLSSGVIIFFFSYVRRKKLTYKSDNHITMPADIAEYVRISPFVLYCVAIDGELTWHTRIINVQIGRHGVILHPACHHSAYHNQCLTFMFIIISRSYIERYGMNQNKSADNSVIRRLPEDTGKRIWLYSILALFKLIQLVWKLMYQLYHTKLVLA